MKEIVPEYKSNNSIYEKLDNKHFTFVINEKLMEINNIKTA